MLKREITYTTYPDDEGNTQTQTGTFYFNLNPDELAELEMRHDGGITGFVQRVSQTNNREVLIKEFKSIILTTYGVRDGDSFVKTDELRARFAGHPAYSELYMEFLTVPGALETFIRGVMPKKYQDPNIADTPAVKLIPPAPPMAHVTPQQVEQGKQIVEGTTNG